MLSLLCLPHAACKADIARVYIAPGNIALNPGAEQHFQVFAVDTDGNEVSPPEPVTWGTDLAAGAITPDGLFTAGQTAGLFVKGVTVSAGGFSAGAPVEVAPAYVRNGYAFSRAWGNFAEGQLNYAGSVAVDAAGNVYVTDSNRIQVFDQNLVYQRQWGTYGTGPGQFWGPTAIAIAPDQTVYVLDSGNHRIQVFETSGDFLRQWGREGLEDGQFINPKGLALDFDLTRIHVLESFSFVPPIPGAGSRVQKFDLQGGFITRWGSQGSGDGQFHYPRGIALDSSGMVYVGDPSNDRIEKFSPEGLLVGHLERSQAFDDLEIDGLDNLYLSSGSTISKLTLTGSQIAQWSVPPGEDYNRGSGSELGIGSAGSIFLTRPGRVVKFGSDGAYLTQHGPDTGKSRLSRPSGVSIDSQGNVWVADTGNNRIQKFDSAGTFVFSFGSSGHDHGQFQVAEDVAVDSEGFVYVADWGNGRIQKFDSAGQYVTQWGNTGAVDERLQLPCAVAVDSLGNVYVAESSNGRVRKFDSDGGFLAELVPPMTDDYGLHAPGCLAVASDGTVYLSYTNDTVHKLSPSGVVLTQWGSEGYGDGQFQGASGVAVDAAGNVYVSDVNNSRIQKFTSSGTFVSKIGSLGGAPSQIYHPFGLDVDGSGKIYVGDNGNSRIQIFSPWPVDQASVPEVTDSGDYTTTNTTLQAGWVSQPAAAIVDYEYAIGTTPGDPGAGYVVPWTSVGASLQTSITDLNLQSGPTYYWYVRAKHANGNWSLTGVSDGIKVDTTYPTGPAVTDDGVMTVDATSLHAIWSASSDPESGIFEYQYAIGLIPVDPGSDYIVPWTPNGVSTQVTRKGLELERGRKYYFYVKAINGAGLASKRSSNGIVVPHVPSSIGLARSLPQLEYTYLKELVVTATPADFPSLAFAQDEDRSAGIQLKTNAVLTRGDRVGVLGSWRRLNGEWQIAVTDLIEVQPGEPPSSLVTHHESIAAADPNEDLALDGVDPTGLLMTVAGKVTAIDAAESAFYIDDGTALADGMLIDGVPSRGLRVTYHALTHPAEGSFAVVTGIVRLEMRTLNQAAYLNGTLHQAGETVYVPSLYPRDQDDIMSF